MSATQPLTICDFVWLVLLLLAFVFTPPLFEMFSVLFYFARWVLVVAGVFLAVVAAANIGRHDHGFVSMAVCLVGLALYFTVGFELGRHVLFEIRKPHYARFLLQAKQTGTVLGDIGVFDSSASAKFAFY